MKDKIIELLKQYEDTHTQGVYRCDYDKLADEVVKLFCQPAVISSACDEIFEQAIKIDIDNDIDYGQFPL